jgi:hypothetical protein
MNYRFWRGFFAFWAGACAFSAAICFAKEYYGWGGGFTIGAVLSFFCWHLSNSEVKK